MSAVVSILSYNIAGHPDTFAKSFLINVIRNSKENSSELLIFCFQEMKGHFDERFHVPIESGFEVVHIQNGCQSVFSNFNLCTIFLKKISSTKSIKTGSVKKCTHLGLSNIGNYTAKYFGNKGAIYTFFSIETAFREKTTRTRHLPVKKEF